MGILVYSLLWVVQDFVHQPYDSLAIVILPITLLLTTHERRSIDLGLGFGGTYINTPRLWP